MTEHRENQRSSDELRKKGVKSFFDGFDRWLDFAREHDQSGLALQLERAICENKEGVEQWMVERSKESPRDTHQNWGDFLDFLRIDRSFTRKTPDNTRLIYDLSSGIDEMAGLQRRGDSVGT